MNYLTRWQRPDVAWPTFGKLSTLRDEIDRLFEAPLAEFARGAQLLSGWSPAWDVFEDKDNVIVKVELPGMKKDEIEVSLHDGTLTISGERKSQSDGNGESATRTERFTGKFRRSITLPTRVDANKVNATYKDGILTITLPKAEEAKPKQIQVNVS